MILLQRPLNWSDDIVTAPHNWNDIVIASNKRMHPVAVFLQALYSNRQSDSGRNDRCERQIPLSSHPFCLKGNGEINRYRYICHGTGHLYLLLLICASHYVLERSNSAITISVPARYTIVTFSTGLWDLTCRTANVNAYLYLEGVCVSVTVYTVWSTCTVFFRRLCIR